jgi:uncharacterized protein YciI
MFAVVLRYLVPIEVIDMHRKSHLEFLDKYYQENVFITSGRQTNNNGGIIIARNVTRPELLKIFEEDSFQQHNCAEYQLFEFTPNKSHPDFAHFLNN